MRIQTMRLEQQGSLFQVKLTRQSEVVEQSYNERGEVTSFSRASRKRMIEMFARMDIKSIQPRSTLFITLTYEWLMRDGTRAKRDLKVFIERIQEKFPNSWIVWRMETQRSSSIHFHLIVGNVRFWKVQKAQAAWNEITGGTALNSLDLKLIKSFRGVRAYVAKYASKTTAPNYARFWQHYLPFVAVMLIKSGKPASLTKFAGFVLMGLSMTHIFSTPPVLTGRRWGVYGRKNVPFAPLTIVDCSASVYTYLIAVSGIGSEWAKWWQSFTIFSDCAKQQFEAFIKTVESSATVELARLQLYFRRQHYLAYVRNLFRMAHSQSLKKPQSTYSQFRERAKLMFEMELKEYLKTGLPLDDDIVAQWSYFWSD